VPATYRYLNIEGDPTFWLLSEPIAATALTASDTPLRLAVTAPRAGTLLLSRRAAASVVLSGVGGATPNGGSILATPFLYLPSVTGLTSRSQASMHELSAATGLTALEADITAAMSAGQDCTVELTEGVIVLNGATLPFVAFFEAAPAAE